MGAEVIIKRLAFSRIGVGFLSGFILVTLAYFAVSGQFTFRVPNDFGSEEFPNGTKLTDNDLDQRSSPPKEEDLTEEKLSSPRQNHDGNDTPKQGEVAEKISPNASLVKPICDVSNPRYDICEMFGDARTVGSASAVYYIVTAQEHNSNSQTWLIRAQSRRYIRDSLRVTVKSVSNSSQAPQCTEKHTMPAVVFTLSKHLRNFWHSFTDVLVPVFVTARAFDGEVQFLVTNHHAWWFVDKFAPVLKALSRHDIIDFDRDEEVRCYTHVIIGLRSHRDLGIDPARTPRNYTMLSFRTFIRSAYMLPVGVDIPSKATKRRPRLMLVNRHKTRKFVNVPEIVEAINKSGFDVVMAEPMTDVNVAKVALLVDSCDVLMGTHGAGLANFVFLRTGAALIQIVPYGNMEKWARDYFGHPAEEMKLRYLEYSISADESTLLEKYGGESAVIKDPESVHRQGEIDGKPYAFKHYWQEQDIRLNMTRFASVLAEAFDLIKG